MKKIFAAAALFFTIGFTANAQEGGSVVPSIDPNAPEMKFEAEVLDYGTVKYDANGVREFKIKNVANSEHPEYNLFLCNSGAEANENAFKLASFQNGRKKIISFQSSFHGRTSLAVAATVLVSCKKVEATSNTEVADSTAVQVDSAAVDTVAVDTAAVK